jgi:hypothetical protein
MDAITDTTRVRLQVFLSYCSAETRIGDFLREILVNDFIGLVNFFFASDFTSIPAGSRWLEDVIVGLRNAQLHVIVCSSHSIGRPWIHYEAGAARVRGIPIIPLCHGGLKPAQLPVPLSESEGGVLTEPATIRKLYMRIAGLIGSDVPRVDFDKYSQDLRDLERDLESIRLHESSTGRTIENLEESSLRNPPCVLCVTSKQFRELGFMNQLQEILDAFPKDIHHYTVDSYDELSQILLNEHVDVAHIAAFVCPRGGDLYFSRVELPLGTNTDDTREIVPAKDLKMLLKKANTRVVILGGSASSVLVASLLPVVHVIAPQDMVSAKAMASWIHTFYGALAKGFSLKKACETALQESQAPMKFYARDSES